MKKAQSKEIVRLLNGIDIDISAEDIKDIKNAEELREYLGENNFFDVEIIYYWKAIQYLSEHDSSLKDSLAIASEYGYKIDDLSSEVLASLLASENVRDSFEELYSKLENILK